ncbi:MAG: hypothetical protein RMM98_17200 [Acidobacteriota bacterium]|nr:hypothetical protein [Acidobacteriota bacterium]
MQSEVGRDHLLIVAYHDTLDSAFAIAKNRQRDQYYQRPYRPVSVFDGVELLQGGSSNPNDINIYNRYRASYERRKNVPSLVRISGAAMLKADSDPPQAQLTLTVEALAPLSGPGPLKVRFVLYEDNINFRALNGQRHFDWVVRDILDEANLSIFEPGATQTFTRTVNLNNQWVAANLGFAVFVQRDPPGNKEVIGAADFHFPTP